MYGRCTRDSFIQRLSKDAGICVCTETAVTEGKSGWESEIIMTCYSFCSWNMVEVVLQSGGLVGGFDIF